MQRSGRTFQGPGLVLVGTSSVLKELKESRHGRCCGRDEGTEAAVRATWPRGLAEEWGPTGSVGLSTTGALSLTVMASWLVFTEAPPLAVKKGLWGWGDESGEGWGGLASGVAGTGWPRVQF